MFSSLFMKKINKCFILVIALIAVSNILWSADGPYVFWENEKPVAVYVKDQQVIRDTLSASAGGEYRLDWLNGQAESVVLQKEFVQPETSLPKPDRFLALSDMHGNLTGTVELLLAAGVMDENYNWIYDGWLIIVGDVLDRGEQTTECLWLLYHLWQQAEETGKGKVIPILGNHETMSLREREHKMDGKYAITCELMGKTYNELYGKDSFIGQWLRSWQTILILDQYLFVHGGISPGLAVKYPELDMVNQLITDFYHDKAVNDEEIDYIFRNNGPFWYRGYFYNEDKWELTTPEIMEGILDAYDLETIIVGHTTHTQIMMIPNQQVIAIDAGLKYQESGQALLFEDNKFFVLASSGSISELSSE
jgi:Calcineurin-like phosphoesterase